MKAPLAICALALVSCICCTAPADVLPCVPDVPCVVDAEFSGASPSWIFRRGTYTHDPDSGARVAQYMRTPPVEPLDDERNFTSRYRRSRTSLRGHDGSVDTYYEVQAWGNGRGGIDAEWERFHDAWKDSILSGGYYNQGQGYGPWGGGGFPGGAYGPGFGSGVPGHGFPGYGFPGYGYGGPWQGGSPHGGGHHGHNGGGHHGGGHHGGGHHGGGHHGGGHHDHDD
jgi:hypothetical protein